MSFYGHVDNIEGKSVRGWLVNRGNLSERCAVAALVGGRVVAEGLAEGFRQDLLSSGIGDGNYAFSLVIPDEWAQAGPIRIVEKSTVADLIGSPVQLSVVTAVASTASVVSAVDRGGAAAGAWAQTKTAVVSPAVAANPVPTQTGLDIGLEDEELELEALDALLKPQAGQALPVNELTQHRQVDHYDRLQKLIAQNSAAEILVRELANLMVRVDAQELTIARLSAALELRQTLLAAPATGATLLPQRAEVSADIFLNDVRGFYGLEWNHTGKPYRWTGPDRASMIDLCVDRTEPKAFNLALLKMRPDGRDHACRILVDGQPVPCRVQQTDALVVLSGILPAAENRAKTEVCILTPTMYCPAEMNLGSSDNRRLGVAFMKLVVDKPASASAGKTSGGTSV